MPKPMTDERLAACKAYAQRAKEYELGSQYAREAIADCIAEIDRLKEENAKMCHWVEAVEKACNGESSDALCGLAQKVAKLRAMLKDRFEWSERRYNGRYCPVCGKGIGHGHASNCELAKLLGAKP